MMLFLLVTALAISYGWGMRGTLLGHGQGAMLPGAMLAMMIALFSGDAVLTHNAVLLGAIGASAMYFGGDMSYGQTIGLTRVKETYHIGQLGLAWKGFLWFGVYGLLLGIGIRVVMGALYGWQALLVLCVFLLPVQKLGVLLFNRPHDPANNVFPKLYFSQNRPESWGGILALLVVLAAFAAVHSDVATLLMGLFSALFAAVGWYFGNYLHTRTAIPFSNGKLLFGGLTRRGRIDGWKIMECVLGFFGGVGTALAFVLFSDEFARRGLLATALPVWLLWVLTALWIFLLVGFLTSVLLADRKPPNAEELKQQLILGHLRQDEYEKRLAQGTGARLNGLLGFVHKIEDTFELLLYAVLPLLVLLQGFAPLGPVVAFFVILLVLFETMCFRKLKVRGIFAWRVAAVLLSAAALALAIFWPGVITPLVCLLLYTFGYTVFCLVYYFHPSRWKEAKAAKAGGKRGFFGAVPGMVTYFLLASAVTIWYVTTLL